VKPHAVRYWEKVFPFLRPTRGLSGRRRYRERELQLFFRLNYLLNRRGLSLAEAERTMWRELSTERIDLKAAIQELRGELLALRDRLPFKKQ